MNAQLTIASLFGLTCIMCGCVTNPDPDPVSESATYIVASVTDYSSGNLGVISVESNTAAKNLLSIHSDNFVRSFGGAIYVLERFGRDNLLKLSRSAAGEILVDYQVDLGDNVNIQDIAFASSTKAYVTEYQSNYILIVNPETGDKVDSIDISEFEVTYGSALDSTEFPSASSAVVVGDTLYVACQRLKSFQPYDTSKIIVLSTITDQVVGSINLLNKNPVSMDVISGKLYVSCAGNSWSSPVDGGVEVIDLATRSNEGVAVTEQQFTGDMGTIVMVSPAKGYASVWISGACVLFPFNPQTKTVAAAIAGVGDASGGLTFDGHHLYAGDRATGSTGVVAIDPQSDSIAPGLGPYDVGIAPSSLAVLKISE